MRHGLLLALLFSGCDFYAGWVPPRRASFTADNNDVCVPTRAESEVVSEDVGEAHGHVRLVDRVVLTEASDCEGGCAGETGRWHPSIGAIDAEVDGAGIRVPAITHEFGCLAIDGAPDQAAVRDIFRTCARRSGIIVVPAAIGGWYIFPQECSDHPLEPCHVPLNYEAVGECAVNECARINTFDLGGGVCPDGGIAEEDAGLDAEVAEVECEPDDPSGAFNRAFLDLGQDAFVAMGGFLYGIVHEGRVIPLEGDPNAIIPAYREFEVAVCFALIAMNSPLDPNSGDVFCNNGLGNPPAQRYHPLDLELPVLPVMVPYLIAEGVPVNGNIAFFAGGGARWRNPDARVEGLGPRTNENGEVCADDPPVRRQLWEAKLRRQAGLDYFEMCRQATPGDDEDWSRLKGPCQWHLHESGQFADYYAWGENETNEGHPTSIHYVFSDDPGDWWVDTFFFVMALDEFADIVAPPIILPPLVAWNKIPTYFARQNAELGERGTIWPPQEAGLMGVEDTFEEILDDLRWPDEAEGDDYDRGYNCSAPGDVPQLHDCVNWKGDNWNH